MSTKAKEEGVTLLKFAYYPYAVSYIGPAPGTALVSRATLVPDVDLALAQKTGDDPVSEPSCFFGKADFDYPDFVSAVRAAVVNDTTSETLGFTIPIGLTVILGLTKSAKTWLGQRLSSEYGMDYMHYGEPDYDSSHKYWTSRSKEVGIFHHHELSTLIAHIVATLLRPTSPGYVLDSYVRNAYCRQGNLTRTGLNISALSELSPLSRVAKALNKRVIVLLGLLDETVYDVALHACTLSAESTLSLVRDGNSLLVNYIFRTRSRSHTDLDGREGFFTIADRVDERSPASAARPSSSASFSARTNYGVPSVRERAIQNLANSQLMKKGE